MQSPRDLVFEITRLLAATGAYRKRVGPKLEALISSQQTELLVKTLNEQRLLTLLGSRATAMAPSSLAPSFTTAVDQALAAVRARGLALEALGLRVVDLLAAAGISALPLKGPFLARRLYGDVGMRLANDLDILVPVERIQEAATLIAGLGYVADDPPWLKGLPDLHYVMRDPDGRLPRIELHWRIHWYEDRFSRDLLEKSEPGEDGMPKAQPDDELAALLLFYSRDGFYGLRMAADIAAWWDSFGGSEGASPVLERHWVDYPRLRRSLEAAATAAQQVVGVPAGAIVPQQAPKGARVRLAVRLGNWTQHGEYDQLAANLDLIDGLLAPNDDLWRFLRRHALLSRREIASVYGFDPDDRVRTLAWQILHGPKVTLRYILGVGGALLPVNRWTRRFPVAFTPAPD